MGGVGARIASLYEASPGCSVDEKKRDLYDVGLIRACMSRGAGVDAVVVVGFLSVLMRLRWDRYKCASNTCRGPKTCRREVSEVANRSDNKR